MTHLGHDAIIGVGEPNGPVTSHGHVIGRIPESLLSSNQKKKFQKGIVKVVLSSGNIHVM